MLLVNTRVQCWDGRIFLPATGLIRLDSGRVWASVPTRSLQSCYDPEGTANIIRKKKAPFFFSCQFIFALGLLGTAGSAEPLRGVGNCSVFIFQGQSQLRYLRGAAETCRRSRPLCDGRGIAPARRNSPVFRFAEFVLTRSDEYSKYRTLPGRLVSLVCPAKPVCILTGDTVRSRK